MSYRTAQVADVLRRLGRCPARTADAGQVVAHDGADLPGPPAVRRVREIIARYGRELAGCAASRSSEPKLSAIPDRSAADGRPGCYPNAGCGSAGGGPTGIAPAATRAFQAS